MRHDYENRLRQIKIASGLSGSTFDYFLVNILQEDEYILSDDIVLQVMGYTSRATKGLVHIPENYASWLKRSVVKKFNLKRR